MMTTLVCALLAAPLSPDAVDEPRWELHLGIGSTGPGVQFNLTSDTFSGGFGLGAGRRLTPQLSVGSDLTLSLLSAGDEQLYLFGGAPYLRWSTSPGRWAGFIEPSVQIAFGSLSGPLGSDAVITLGGRLWAGGRLRLEAFEFMAGPTVLVQRIWIGGDSEQSVVVGLAGGVTYSF